MPDIAHYRGLPYTRKAELRTDPDGSFYFVARIVEIPALRIHGATREEALLRLDEIFDDVIASMLEMDEEIPEPVVWPGKRPSAKQTLVASSSVEETVILARLPGWAKPVSTGALTSAVA